VPFLISLACRCLNIPKQTFFVNILISLADVMYSIVVNTLVSNNEITLQCIPGPVTTWVGDCPLTGKQSRYATYHLSQLSLPSLWDRLIEYIGLPAGIRRGGFAHFFRVDIIVGSLCDPTWQMTTEALG